MSVIAAIFIQVESFLLPMAELIFPAHPRGALAAGGADVGSEAAAHGGVDAERLKLLLEAVYIGIVCGG